MNVVRDYDLNHPELSQLLYTSLLNKSRLEIESEHYETFLDYQLGVQNMVEFVQDLELNEINQVLDELFKVDPTLPDNFIMCWSQPSIGSYLGQKKYYLDYQKNIGKYQEKLLELRENVHVKNFCLESWSKPNNIPIHCLDLIYQSKPDDQGMEFIFSNWANGSNVGIKPLEDDFVEVTMNFERYLSLGLGQMRKLILDIIGDDNMVEMLLKNKTGDNFRSQREIIQRAKLV